MLWYLVNDEPRFGRCYLLTEFGPDEDRDYFAPIEDEDG
jgi:hypothetical protein